MTSTHRTSHVVATFAFLLALQSSIGTASAQSEPDWVTGFPRESVRVAAWPGGKKVAVAFVLFVEQFGFGQGPGLRPDLATRNPDLTNEAFRQYAVTFGNLRVGRLFKELDVPLSIALNAEFPGAHPAIWKEFRASVPSAPIIAHGMNNTNRYSARARPRGAEGLHPSDVGRDRERDRRARRRLVEPEHLLQRRYHAAIAAEGITYTIDQMDSDVVSRLKTPDGSVVYSVSGRHHRPWSEFPRMKTAVEIEDLWVDYVAELAREARTEPSREATTVAIGIHSFVVGTPDGAAVMRRVLERFKEDRRSGSPTPAPS